MITQFVNAVLPYKHYSYLLMLLVLIACGMGLPVPEDIVLVVSGIFAAYKITHFWNTVIICMIGVILGDSVVFSLGYFFGSRILKSKFLSKMIKTRHIAMVRLASYKYGNYLIFLARFMPGVRTPVFFSMGMFKKPFLIFIIIDGVAALISVPIWVFCGMFFGDNIPALEYHIKQMETGMYVIIAAIIIIVVGFHYLKKKFIRYIFKKPEIN